MPMNGKPGKTRGAGKASAATSRGKSRRPATVSEPTQKRAYLKQSDVPAASLDEALRVPEAILEHYAGRPTQPLHLAKALNVDPKGSQLKVLSGAAMAFGLTEGGSQATSIGITDLARRILRPTVEGGADVAKREAVLAPRVFGEFLRTYNGHNFPRPDIAINVLEGMGVPRNKASEVLERIETSARNVGYLEEIKGKLYVSLGAQPMATAQPPAVSSNTPAYDELPCSGQLIPDTVLSFSSATAGARPSLN